MKKIYFFLFSTIIFAGCQKDEISSSLKNETTQEGAVQRIPFKDLPKQILQNFDGNKFIKIKKKLEGTAFGKARTDIDVYINTDKTATTYTIALNRSNKGIKSVDGLYFDNYVAKELQDGSLEEYVIRYLPDEVWYNQENRELRDYSGEVIFFDLEGTKLGKTAIFDGQANAIDSNQNKGSCVITFKKMICTDGLYGLEGNCVYEYQLTCSSGSSYDSPPSGGDDGTPSWDSGDSSGGTGGDSTGDGDSGGPGSVNTNPIINDEGELITVECPLGQEPNSFGVCTEITADKNLSNWDALNDNINIDESIYDFPCLTEVLNEVLALDDNLVDETINQFCGNEDYNLTFTVGDCDGNPACTSDTLLNTTGEIVIKIEDVHLNPIDFATHILHESIHAEIFRYVDAHHNGEVDPNNKPQLFEYYERYKLAYDSTHIDHPYMSQYYIDPIAEALQKLDNFRYTNLDYYKVFAYDGLRDFDPYENFITIDEDFGQYRNEVTENFNIKCND